MSARGVVPRDEIGTRTHIIRKAVETEDLDHGDIVGILLTKVETTEGTINAVERAHFSSPI